MVLLAVRAVGLEGVATLDVQVVRWEVDVVVVVVEDVAGVEVVEEGEEGEVVGAVDAKFPLWVG